MVHLRFLFLPTRKSHSIAPHFAANNEPTEIEMIAEDSEGIVWRYVLKATKERVLHEALYRKNVRFSYVFLRDWSDEKREYQVKQQGFGLASSEAKKVRPNASLISTALQYGIELAQHVTPFLIVSNSNFVGRPNFQSVIFQDIAARLHTDEPLRLKLVALLINLDFGLSDIQITQLELPGKSGKSEKAYIPCAIHITREGNSASLRVEEESNGIQTAFLVLSHLLGVLSSGGVAVVDGLERNLHPHLLEPIVGLFANQATNPLGAQLIFTCQAPDALDLLDKSQVIFIEKNDCESEAFRGDTIEGLRNEDNLRAKYVASALGAVPRFQ